MKALQRSGMREVKWLITQYTGKSPVVCIGVFLVWYLGVYCCGDVRIVAVSSGMIE